MGPKPTLTPDLKNAIERFKKSTGVGVVIVFGSHAWGQPTEHSDVDIIIVDPRFEGQRFFERPVELRSHWPRDLPVDMLCYTPDEYEDLKQRPTIVREASRDGITA